MASLNDLSNLASGTPPISFAGSAGNATIVVTNPNNTAVGCVPCDEDVCSVSPTQAVTLDLGAFTTTNSKIALNIDTTPNPGVDQKLVLFADYSGTEANLHPRVSDLLNPPYGLMPPAIIGPVTVSVTAGSPTITATSGTFPVADITVGTSVGDGTNFPLGTYIVALVDSTHATASVNALVSDSLPLYFGSDTYLPNGNLINAAPGWAVLAGLNKEGLHGGALLASISFQYNNVTYPAGDNVTFVAAHLPADLNSSVETTLELNPLCDSCISNNNGNFTTHTYTFGRGISWRDLMSMDIPGSEAGLKAKLYLCFASLGLPNTQQSPYLVASK